MKLFFKNGLEEEVDILIAADGIKSVARESFPNEGIFYTGTDVFRGLIPKETFVKSYPNHRTLEEPVIVSQSYHCLIWKHANLHIDSIAARIRT